MKFYELRVNYLVCRDWTGCIWCSPLYKSIEELKQNLTNLDSENNWIYEICQKVLNYDDNEEGSSYEDFSIDYPKELHELYHTDKNADGFNDDEEDRVDTAVRLIDDVIEAIKDASREHHGHIGENFDFVLIERNVHEQKEND